MTRHQEKLQQRAAKAGIRKAKRVHHVLSEQEVRALKVQVLPFLPRALIAVAGSALIVAAVNGFPPSSSAGQACVGIGGGFLSGILDNLGPDVAGQILGGVIEAIVDKVDL
jgi:hypothetical protein